MKINNLCMIVLLLFAVAGFFPACGNPSGPEDHTPKDIVVNVKYVRMQPLLYPEAMSSQPSISWVYDPLQGGLKSMSFTNDENTFTANIQIKSETVITVCVTDMAEYNGGSAGVCKYIYIDEQELKVAGDGRGLAKFIYRNDGKVELWTGS